MCIYTRYTYIYLYLYIYLTSSLSNHLLMSIWVVSMSWPL
ncbi:hypothetical protein G4228_019334 [Cervus hanglu yarkandensis]|nr:hypothetical protein G4228_019334 [Cervus hanglu yarkandensis]